jgi:hypothetical protein
VFDEHFQACLERICSILDGLGLPYHFTGGIAASFYGEPRFTQDLDLVVQLSADRPETRALLERLSLNYYLDHQIALDAIRRKSLFQVIDGQSAIKIDFHVGEKIPGELQRSTRQELLPGLTISLVSREDAILSKLLWIRLGSEKSKRDVIQMLRGAENMDWTRLRKEALRLGLATELSRIEEAAKSWGDQTGYPRIDD